MTAHNPASIVSTYLSHALDMTDLPHTLDVALGYMKPLFDSEAFDSIAFCGMSGALLATPLALALGCDLILVRKESDECHSYEDVEGNYNSRAYLIVDDFISSGATVEHIIKSIDSVMPNAKCIGIVEARFLAERPPLRTEITPAEYYIDRVFNRDY